jgi:hypothetical protein
MNLSKALLRLRFLPCRTVHFIAGDIDWCAHATNREFLESMWLVHLVFAWPFTFLKPPTADLDAARYGADQCSIHTSLLA